MSAIQQAIAGHIAVIDGQITTTTQDIAEVYVKRHDDVLRIVRKRMAEAGEWGVRNFTDTPYTNPQNGQTYPVIRMTKKGFHFVVGKFTGAKAVKHQIAFADEFERMERELVNNAYQLPATITPAQAQHLKELADIIVATGVQKTHGETWTRFHRKFRVNSYLELPASKFNDAVAYLRAKVQVEDVKHLLQQHYPEMLRLSAPQPETLNQIVDRLAYQLLQPNSYLTVTFEPLIDAYLVKTRSVLIKAEAMRAHKNALTILGVAA